MVGGSLLSIALKAFIALKSKPIRHCSYERFSFLYHNKNRTHNNSLKRRSRLYETTQTISMKTFIVNLLRMTTLQSKRFPQPKKLHKSVSSLRSSYYRRVFEKKSSFLTRARQYYWPPPPNWEFNGKLFICDHKPFFIAHNVFLSQLYSWQLLKNSILLDNDLDLLKGFTQDRIMMPMMTHLAALSTSRRHYSSFYGHHFYQAAEPVIINWPNCYST